MSLMVVSLADGCAGPFAHIATCTSFILLFHFHLLLSLALFSFLPHLSLSSLLSSILHSCSFLPLPFLSHSTSFSPCFLTSSPPLLPYPSSPTLLSFSSSLPLFTFYFCLSVFGFFAPPLPFFTCSFPLLLLFLFDLFLCLSCKTWRWMNWTS